MPPNTMAASRPLPTGNASVSHLVAGRRYQRLNGSSGGEASCKKVNCDLGFSASSASGDAAITLPAARDAQRNRTFFAFIILIFIFWIAAESLAPVFAGKSTECGLQEFQTLYGNLVL